MRAEEINVQFKKTEEQLASQKYRLDQWENEIDKRLVASWCFWFLVDWNPCNSARACSNMRKIIA